MQFPAQGQRGRGTVRVPGDPRRRRDQEAEVGKDRGLLRELDIEGGVAAGGEERAGDVRLAAAQLVRLAEELPQPREGREVEAQHAVAVQGDAALQAAQEVELVEGPIAVDLGPDPQPGNGAEQGPGAQAVEFGIAGVRPAAAAGAGAEAQGKIDVHREHPKAPLGRMVGLRHVGATVAGQRIGADFRGAVLVGDGGGRHEILRSFMCPGECLTGLSAKVQKGCVRAFRRKFRIFLEKIPLGL